MRPSRIGRAAHTLWWRPFGSCRMMIFRHGCLVLLIFAAVAWPPCSAAPASYRALLQDFGRARPSAAPDLPPNVTEVKIIPPEVAGAPLATLGPLPAYTGQSLLITMDLWGPGLLDFNIQQQEIFLAVMNVTISNVEDDELQLLKVEDILPLSGPSAVSIFSTKTDDTNDGSRRLLRRGLRKLLQTGPLVTSGNPNNISNLPHLEVTVRASVEPNEVDLLKQETSDAVAGPMLPMLVQQGIDVQYMTLSSIAVNYGMQGAPAPQPHGRSLHAGDISAIVIGSVAVPTVIVVGCIVVGRRRAKRRQAVLGKKASMSDRSSIMGAGSSADGSVLDPIDGLHVFVADRLPYSRSLTPNGSLVGSAESNRESAKGQTKTNGVMDPEICTVPFEELQFSRVIGEGSYGRVFLGKWQETTVAIKILLSQGGGPLPDDSWDVQDVSRLRDSSWSQRGSRETPAQKMIVEELGKEARLMAKLRHPNTVMFLGASLSPPCMVTEFCARGSLLDVLHRARTNEVVRKEVDWRRRLRLALDAAKGMNYLHSRQPPILHRDLKSANLLVDKHWQAKVADFNLSRVMHPSTVISSIAATNPRWLPPEVLAGGSYETSTDVYAFGVILWELISWEIPWKEDTPWQVVIAVVDHDQRPEIPSEAEALGGYPVARSEYLELLQSCWAKDSQQRPNFESIINTMRTLIEAEDAVVTRSALPIRTANEPEVVALQTEAQPSSKVAHPLSSPFLNMPALPTLPSVAAHEEETSVHANREEIQGDANRIKDSSVQLSELGNK